MLEGIQNAVKHSGGTHVTIDLDDNGAHGSASGFATTGAAWPRESSAEHDRSREEAEHPRRRPNPRRPFGEAEQQRDQEARKEECAQRVEA